MSTPIQHIQPATILVVENEVSNRLLIERVLSTRGYRCLSASNGREALDVLDKQPVDSDGSLDACAGWLSCDAADS